jgi:hypothetical protein
MKKVFTADCFLRDLVLTASTVTAGAAYELYGVLLFIRLLSRAMNSSSCAQVFAVPDVDLTAA